LYQLAWERGLEPISLSKKSIERLTWLAKEWYVVKGESPMPFNRIIERLIDRQWDVANPPQYRGYYERLD
jgi:hypothetical protein